MKQDDKLGENIIKLRLIEKYQNYIKSRVNLIWRIFAQEACSVCILKHR